MKFLKEPEAKSMDLFDFEAYLGWQKERLLLGGFNFIE